ncbi:MAG: choice-of-anchor tandem repeat GloVer-containing protein [Candidatus Cybelea sp.]|jgi:uncharacterized repeat protein (TIGR03803 family)
MKRFYRLGGACFSAALLAACGANNGLSSTTPILVAPQRLELQFGGPLSGTAYKTLFTFRGRDGAGPSAVLFGVSNQPDTLYGTTVRGGGPGPCYRGPSAPGCGTVFAVSTSGQEHVLYAFKGATDGEHPHGNPISLHGTLYGTTLYGGHSGCYGSGSYGCGTIFEVTTSGAESVLYRFKGDPDGAAPAAGLIAVNGMLYGTTKGGGTANKGTVFEVSTSGIEHVVHSFRGYPHDGQNPSAALISLHGKLYGTTSEGGSSAKGAIFTITTSGQERVLYSFGALPDGAHPEADLVGVNDVLFGTTSSGGATANCNLGCGTVFKVSTSGQEQVLYRFKGDKDGADPVASLIALNGKLYGTTASGGERNYQDGYGTVFEVSTSGHERLLHTFGAEGGGSSPEAGLLTVKGRLYGTTSGGGREGRHLLNTGTVFRISP